MNYYIVNQDWLDHLIKCGGFLGHDAVKVQLSSAPDDGQKRVALTRGELDRHLNKRGIHIGMLTQKDILDGIFGEEAGDVG